MGTERITIFDTTLRDGEQSPGCSMNLDEKLQMARQLEALGKDLVAAEAAGGDIRGQMSASLPISCRSRGPKPW